MDAGAGSAKMSNLSVARDFAEARAKIEADIKRSRHKLIVDRPGFKSLSYESKCKMSDALAHVLLKRHHGRREK